jgi:tRNA-dihydrouridine synthase
MALEFAMMAQAAGAAAVAVHGRTAAQLYQGQTDRRLLPRLVKALRVPVIASGDIFTSAAARDYLDAGAGAVMIARGARGNPWIFAQTSALLTQGQALAKPSLVEVIDVAEEHTRRLHELYPWRLASMRRHLAWYFKGMPGSSALRHSAQSCATLDDYLLLFTRLRSRVAHEESVAVGGETP